MKSLCSISLLLFALTGSAQRIMPLGQTVTQTLSFGLGLSLPFSEQKPLGFNVLAEAGIYRDFGVAAGLRMGRYSSPDIPFDYSRNSLISFGEDNVVFNDFRSFYAQFTRKWYSSKTKSVYVKAGAGIAFSSVEAASFTPNTSSSGSGGPIYFPGPTHDVSRTNKNTFGPTAQLGLHAYVPSGKISFIDFGMAIWTLPNYQQYLVGVDFQISLLLAVKTKAPIQKEEK